MFKPIALAANVNGALETRHDENSRGNRWIGKWEAYRKSSFGVADGKVRVVLFVPDLCRAASQL